MEIACDESGFVGGSLFGEVRVFAHASVTVDRDEAAELLTEVRRRTGAGPGEVKASLLRRPWAQPVAAWLCGPEGRLGGRAAVHVTDTRLFGLARLAQVLTCTPPPEGWWSADEDPDAWELGHRLHALVAGLPPRAARRILDAARDLLWLNRRVRTTAPVEGWRSAVGELEHHGATADPGLVASLASPAAVRRAHAYQAAPPSAPLTEPLLPALRWALHHWSRGGDLAVVHDEQSVLTPARVRALADDLAAAQPGSRLVDLARVDSREDPRIQVADLVAGVVRRSVETGLTGVPHAPAVAVEHLVAGASPLTAATRNWLSPAEVTGSPWDV